MKNNTRDIEILAVAARLFIESGFANTKMIDIARECGLSKGLMYFYYKNKEDLYLAVLQYALTINLSFAESTFSELKDESGLDCALALLDRFLTLSIETVYFQEIIINTMQLTDSDNHPGIARKMGLSSEIYSNPRLDDIRQKQIDIYGVVKQAITNGQQDGSIRNTSTPALIYLSIWSFIIGFETMMPVVKNYKRSTDGPIHEYLHVDPAEWKDNILDFSRQILLTEQTVTQR